MAMIRHWTISRLADYELCPAKADYSVNKKCRGITAPAAQRGIDVHASIEQYLLGKTNQIHKEIRPIWRNQIIHLRHYFRAVPERMWELTEGWNARVLDNEPLWLRAKIDAHFRNRPRILNLIDFKTGKPYHHNVEQLEVYSLIAFALFDDVDTVDGQLWYLDYDEPDSKTFKRADAPKLARKWEGRARPFLEATTFPHRPGKHCGWCAFRDACPAALRAA
jgi:PD-(D/E)XK nuclease superfamily